MVSSSFTFRDLSAMNNVFRVLICQVSLRVATFDVEICISTSIRISHKNVFFTILFGLNKSESMLNTEQFTCCVFSEINWELGTSIQLP